MGRVTVAAGSQLAADAGAAIADAGGNAVDAAVAAVMATMCTEPGIVAPGACGFVTVHPAGEARTSSTGTPRCRAGALRPRRSGRDDRSGSTTAVASTPWWGTGRWRCPGSTPPSRRRGGARQDPVAQLFEPAIAAVDRGFPLSATGRRVPRLRPRGRVRLAGGARSVMHHPDGSPLRAPVTWSWSLISPTRSACWPTRAPTRSTAETSVPRRSRHRGLRGRGRRRPPRPAGGGCRRDGAPRPGHRARAAPRRGGA